MPTDNMSFEGHGLEYPRGTDTNTSHPPPIDQQAGNNDKVLPRKQRRHIFWRKIEDKKEQQKERRRLREAEAEASRASRAPGSPLRDHDRQTEPVDPHRAASHPSRRSDTNYIQGRASIQLEADPANYYTTPRYRSGRQDQGIASSGRILAPQGPGAYETHLRVPSDGHRLRPFSYNTRDPRSFVPHNNAHARPLNRAWQASGYNVADQVHQGWAYRPSPTTTYTTNATHQQMLDHSVLGIEPDTAVPVELQLEDLGPIAEEPEAVGALPDSESSNHIPRLLVEGLDWETATLVTEELRKRVNLVKDLEEDGRYALLPPLRSQTWPVLLKILDHAMPPVRSSTWPRSQSETWSDCSKTVVEDADESSPAGLSLEGEPAPGEVKEVETFFTNPSQYEEWA